MVDDEDESDWIDRDEEFEAEEANENSGDLSLTEEAFSTLLVAPADWTIETLYSQIGRQIDLDPDFQRRNVWSAKAKSRFIESLFLGIPIPQILLSARPAKKSSFLVLDGKQRLIAIKEFMDGKFSNGRTFRLRELRITKELEGKSWADIQNDNETAGKLLNETQRTTVLRGWEDEAVLYEIFFRLNSGSVKLSPMELRMSLYPGGFLKFIIAWTEKIGPLHRLLKKKTPDSRMADVELSVRFLAFADPAFEYKGDLKKFLDEMCVSYNEKFSDEDFFQSLEQKLNEMNSAIQFGIEIFTLNKFCRKFVDGKYENRFNRALFDILAQSFSHRNVRDWVSENRQTLIDAYEHLCSTDNDFIRSVETTTKSKDATFYRFDKWYKLIDNISGIKLAMPNIAI